MIRNVSQTKSVENENITKSRQLKKDKVLHFILDYMSEKINIYCLNFVGRGVSEFRELCQCSSIPTDKHTALNTESALVVLTLLYVKYSTVQMSKS